CRRCRAEVIEPAGSDSDSRVFFLAVTVDDYEQREFSAAITRARSQLIEPAPEQLDGPPMRLDDYFRRELAYDRRLGNWMLVWVVVFFGVLFGLVLIQAALDRAGVPKSVIGAITIAYLFSSLPGLIIFDRVATRKLSRRYGLICPDCLRSCVAPRVRRPGHLINVSTCRHCGQAMVEVQREATGR